MRKLAFTLLLLLSANPAFAAGPAEQARGVPDRAARISVPGDDIMAIAFIALMEAAKSAQEDLRAIMASVKAINDAKKKQRENMGAMPEHSTSMASKTADPCPTATALRDCIRRTRLKLMKMEFASLDLMRASVLAAQGTLKLLTDSLRRAPEEIERMRNNLPPPARIIPPNPCRGWNVSFWRQCLVVVKVELAGNLLDASSQAEIDTQIAQMKGQLDAMSDLSETTQLRLQMAMDRLSKAMSMLSNMLKKISETQDQIIRNLK
jgi:hypothetical protein